LLALNDGDSVSLSGALTPKVWVDKQGKPRPAINLIAHKILTVIRKKRLSDINSSTSHLSVN
jgi:hypothetical protein